MSGDKALVFVEGFGFGCPYELAAALAELGPAYQTEGVVTKPQGSAEQDGHVELSRARQAEILG